MAIDFDAEVLAPMFEAMAVPAAYCAPGTIVWLPVDGIFDREMISPDDGEEATGALQPYRSTCRMREATFPLPDGPVQNGRIAAIEPVLGSIPDDVDVYVITDARGDGRGLVVTALARAGKA